MHVILVWIENDQYSKGCNTIAAIKSYYSNLKNIPNFIKKWFGGELLNWLIYHIIDDVLTYYLYGSPMQGFWICIAQKIWKHCMLNDYTHILPTSLVSVN
jgi:hypothetical protein